jgi:IMP dehydrogenase
MITNGLCFDDVLLIPRYSEIKSRADVSTIVKLCKGFSFSSPVVPSNMRTITGLEMAYQIYAQEGLGIVHRFMPITDQLRIARELSHALKFIGFSVGVKEDDYECVDRFVGAGVQILCVDVAHGHSLMCGEIVKYIASKYPDVLLIAGNVATGDGAGFLWRAGADIVKAGIGNGSICTTRIATGNGVPLLSTLMEIKSEKGFFEKELDRSLYIMADGGAKNSGDLVKGLCFADMVMSGNLFAGCEETPGDTIELGGKLYKKYEGSSTHKTNHIEGVKSVMPLRPKVGEVMGTLLEGIRSGCSYQSVDSVKKLQDNPKFVRQTGLGFRESGAHDVQVID